MTTDVTRMRGKKDVILSLSKISVLPVLQFKSLQKKSLSVKSPNNKWQVRKDLNLQPPVLETGAPPIELRTSNKSCIIITSFVIYNVIENTNWSIFLFFWDLAEILEKLDSGDILAWIERLKYIVFIIGVIGWF